MSWRSLDGFVVGLSTAAGADVVCSRRGHGPSGVRRAQSEHGEACEVVGCGEEVEVGVDLACAAYSGSSPAVFASHHVAELAFDFGSGGPVVVGPGGVLLVIAGIGESLFVAADADGASTSGVGALGSHRAIGAGAGEGGDPVAVGVAADGDGDPRWTGDGVGVEIDREAVLGEQPTGGGGWLGLAARLDVVF